MCKIAKMIQTARELAEEWHDGFIKPSPHEMAAMLLEMADEMERWLPGKEERCGHEHYAPNGQGDRILWDVCTREKNHNGCHQGVKALWTQ